MKTPWTKGPWTLGDENNASAEVCMGDVACSFDRFSRDPGKCGQMVIGREEMLANAHLAIAAPDLAEALAKLLAEAKRLHVDDVLGSACVAARAALKKAGALDCGCRDTEREES